jgi:hypothetical protein
MKKLVGLVLCLQVFTGCSSTPTSMRVESVNVVRTTVAEEIGPGGQRSGPQARAAQKKLLKLGFWLASSSGEFDETTRQAVMAFQKYFRLKPTGSITPGTAYLLNAADHPVAAQSTNGTLAEIDKQRQLLFIVQDGKTVAVLNASTGDDREYEEPDANSPGVIIRGVALTPEGTFAIDRERPDGWWIGDLGQIYRPKYFIGGVAIHGSTSVPAYPASHGCVRVSVAAMDMIWDRDLLPRGTTVVVHSGVLA